MSRGRSSSRSFVRSGVRYELCGVQQRFECARVGPPAVKNAVRQAFLSQIHIIYVGDLKLVAPTDFCLADFFKNGGIVKVDPRNRVIGLWSFRFFFDAENLAVYYFGTGKL